MTRTARTMLAAALIFVSAGIIFGFLQAAIARHDTTPVQNFRAQWAAANSGQSYDEVSYRNTRVVDAHTHIIKLATVLFLFALVFPLINLNERAKRIAAVMFVCGTCLFPAGVLAENSTRARWPQAIAAIGAMLVLVSFSIALWGLVLGTAEQPATR